MTRRLIITLALAGILCLAWGTSPAGATSKKECAKHPDTAACVKKYGHPTTTVATTVPAPTTTPTSAVPSSSSPGQSTPSTSVTTTTGAGTPPASVLAHVELLPATGNHWSPDAQLYLVVVLVAGGFALAFIARRRSDA